MKRSGLLGLAAFFCLLLFSACGSSQADSMTDTGLKVVATNSIIADLAKEVGGSHIALHSIVPVGTDPHEYEPLPEDIRKASEAQVILYNGLNLETGNGWFDNLMETTGKTTDEEYFAVSKNVRPLYLEGGTEEDQKDPHAWLDIANGITYVTEIQRIFSEKDPAHAQDYANNAAAYIDKLTALHETAQSAFADIPEEKRLLVTSEGAFRYFAKAYGLEAAYIWAINTESQGTPEQMKKIVDMLRAAAIPNLFVESSIDHRSMERVAQETGLPIFAELYTDSLANAGTDGDTYYGMMEWNIRQIHAGLSE